jgi:hypothetical protein
VTVTGQILMAARNRAPRGPAQIRVRMLGMLGRALSFGMRAQAYERFRPRYPFEPLDMVMTYAGQPVRTALEISAGTGKATRWCWNRWPASQFAANSEVQIWLPLVLARARGAGTSDCVRSQ